MSFTLIYAGNQRSRDVVEFLTAKLVKRPDIIHAAEPAAASSAAELFLFLTPTYGDEELHQDMESCLVKISARHRRYIICELGNYYGYDDFEFGAASILREQLNQYGWLEASPSLSLDALPRIDWPALERWIVTLNQQVLT